MRIIIERQSVVADVMNRITRFLHGTQRHGFYQVLLLLSFDIVQQAVDRLRYLCLSSAVTNLITETCDELTQVLKFIWVWQIVDTIREHFRLLVLWHLTYMLGYSTIGQKHELFNKLVCLFRFLEIYAERLSVLIDFELHLATVEVD